MARRESQGLQIALIVFVMLTIILAVTTIAFWNRSKSLTGEMESLSQEVSTLRSATSTAVEEAGRMKQWIGHAADMSIEAIQEQYDRDMATYAASAPEVQRTYKDVPVILFGAVQQRNKQVADLRAQLKQAQDEFEQSQQTLQAALDESNRMKTDAEASLLKTRDEFASNRSELNSQKEGLSRDLQSLRQEFDALKSKSENDLQDLKREVENKDLIIGQRDDQLEELTTSSFEVPDGKILFVNQRTGRALINLGRSDALRRQVTFTVYAVDVNNVAQEDPKGTVEVVRIVGDHTAEVRIMDDSLSEPILAGDVIYTPLWSSNTSLRFAIAGKMDINDDGRDDFEMVRNLIRVNGGRIDAEVKDGQLQGEITARTRYLVLGEQPSVDGGDVSGVDAWSELVSQADRMRVEHLNLDELLDFVGYDGEKRTVPLGDKADSDDFQPRPKREAGPGSQFRDRGRRPKISY